MSQKCEKRSNVINDYFIIKETRKINRYNAKQNRNYI